MRGSGADLDRREPLDPGHRFPAPGVTALVTATAVLRLVADGAVGLDRPANDHHIPGLLHRVTSPTPARMPPI